MIFRILPGKYMNSCNIWNINSKFREMFGWHTKKGTCIHRLYIYGFWREDGIFFFLFWMRPLYFRIKKTFSLRKTLEVVKRKGRVCILIGRGEAEQLHFSGKAVICRVYSELIHLHLPSQPAPGAGWMTHNTPQMSLSSRVHQLKLINIPPHTEDVPPAQQAAGQAMAEHNNSSSSSSSQSPGQQVHLAGSREGHSVALASPAHILCRQSWVVYKLIAEGIWLKRELSALHSVLRETWTGGHAGWLGATHQREKILLLPPDTHLTR